MSSSPESTSGSPVATPDRVDHPPFSRVTAVLAGVVAVGLLASACTAASGGAGTSTVTTTVASSPAASSRAPASPSGSATTTAGAGAATAPTTGSSGSAGSAAAGSTVMCAESQLKATINFQNPAGTINAPYHPVIVYFQNTSSSACVITGYPGAAVVDAQGKQVVEATRTLRGNALGLPPGRDTVPVVTLQPGAYASAGLEGVSTRESGTAQAGCSTGTYPGIIVTPPNTSIPVPFTVPWPYCFSFQVHPVNTEDNPPS